MFGITTLEAVDMTPEQNNMYLTCISCGRFYKKISYYVYKDKEVTCNNLRISIRTCLYENSIPHFARDLIVVAFEVAKYYQEEFPELLKIVTKKHPEFTTETKSYIEVRDDVDDFLESVQKITSKVEKLTNPEKLFMKYSKGFHTPTIYNNQDVNDLSKEDLMEAIRAEKAKIKSVEDLKESKTIQAEIKQAEENIAKLLQLLDKDADSKS